MAAQLALVVTATAAPSYDATPRVAEQVAGAAGLVTLRFSPLEALRRFAESIVLRLLPAPRASRRQTPEVLAVTAPGSHLRLVR